MKDWTEEPIDFTVWKRLHGNPFADYDPLERIALWSLWEMPSCSVGKLLRRGRPACEPTQVRSVRLPVKTWARLEQDARAASTSLNSLLKRRLG